MKKLRTDVRNKCYEEILQRQCMETFSIEIYGEIWPTNLSEKFNGEIWRICLSRKNLRRKFTEILYEHNWRKMSWRHLIEEAYGDVFGENWWHVLEKFYDDILRRNLTVAFMEKLYVGILRWYFMETFNGDILRWNFTETSYGEITQRYFMEEFYGNISGKQFTDTFNGVLPRRYFAMAFHEGVLYRYLNEECRTFYGQDWQRYLVETS